MPTKNQKQIPFGNDRKKSNFDYRRPRRSLHFPLRFAPVEMTNQVNPQ
jgi:hypothetical protein